MVNSTDTSFRTPLKRSLEREKRYQAISRGRTREREEGADQCPVLCLCEAYRSLFLLVHLGFHSEESGEGEEEVGGFSFVFLCSDVTMREERPPFCFSYTSRLSRSCSRFQSSRLSSVLFTVRSALPRSGDQSRGLSFFSARCISPPRPCFLLFLQLPRQGACVVMD